MNNAKSFFNIAFIGLNLLVANGLQAASATDENPVARMFLMLGSREQLTGRYTGLQDLTPDNVSELEQMIKDGSIIPPLRDEMLDGLMPTLSCTQAGDGTRHYLNQNAAKAAVLLFKTGSKFSDAVDFPSLKGLCCLLSEVNPAFGKYANARDFPELIDGDKEVLEQLDTYLMKQK